MASLMDTLDTELCRVFSVDGLTSLSTNMTGMLSKFKQTRERIGPASTSTSHLVLLHWNRVKLSQLRM